MEALLFDGGARLLLKGGLVGGVEFALSLKPVEGEGAHERADTIADIAEVSGTGYTRQASEAPLSFGDVFTFPQVEWNTGSATNWEDAGSVVLVKGITAIAAFGIKRGSEYPERHLPAHSVYRYTARLRLGPEVPPPEEGKEGEPQLTWIPYGPGADNSEDEVVTVVYPASKPGRPVVVMVHGGSWSSGNAKPGEAPANDSANKMLQSTYNFCVIDINYPLIKGPTGTNPGAPKQTAALPRAFQWVVDHCADYNGDPAKVCAVGTSAGGHVAMWGAITANKAHSGRVKGVGTLSGPVALVTLEQIVLGELPGGPSLSAAGEVGHAYPARTFSEAYDPASHVESTCPNMLCFHSHEKLVPFALAETLRAAMVAAGYGSRITIVQKEGTGHGAALMGACKVELAAFVEAVT
jgi:acetyl esterase/lipase